MRMVATTTCNQIQKTPMLRNIGEMITLTSFLMTRMRRCCTVAALLKEGVAAAE